MCNFSNIGFQVTSEQQLRNLVESVCPRSCRRQGNQGFYLQYADPSGAELWIQVNQDREIIGVNPFYNSRCRRMVRLISEIQRFESMLDGAYHCWAIDKTDPEHQSLFQFVFDRFLITFSKQRCCAD